MNFSFKFDRGAPAPTPRAPRSPLRAAWSRDPRTGRLTQTWRSSDDGERSCTRRPSRPPATRLPVLALAA